jgi:hypothetical protein
MQTFFWQFSETHYKDTLKKYSTFWIGIQCWQREKSFLLSHFANTTIPPQHWHKLKRKLYKIEVFHFSEYQVTKDTEVRGLEKEWINVMFLHRGLELQKQFSPVAAAVVAAAVVSERLVVVQGSGETLLECHGLESLQDSPSPHLEVCLQEACHPRLHSHL